MHRRILGGLTLVLIVLVGTAVPAGAGTDPVSLARSGLVCEVTAGADGFEVRWNAAGVADADRVVVERRMHDRWWWRGRIDPSVGTFADGVAPRNAARVEYRVVTKDAAGSVLDTADCDLLPTQWFGCAVTREAGTYRVEVDPLHEEFDGEAVDFVIRRSASLGGAWYWRGRTDSFVFDDPSPERAEVRYEVLARVDGVIFAATPCRNLLADPACVTPMTQAEVDELLYPSSIDVDDALVEAADPDHQATWVHPAPDGSLYYLVPVDGRSALRRYDPIDESTTTIAADVGPEAGAWIVSVDAGGFAVVEAGDAAVTRTLYGPDGLVLDWMATDEFSLLANALGGLLDGRVAMVRAIHPSPEVLGPARIMLFSPDTGVYEPLIELEGLELEGLTPDGDLVVRNPWSSDQLFVRYDDACL